MTTVAVQGSSITVRELVLVDEEAAKALSDVVEPERPDAVRRAMKVGLVLMRDVVPIAKADFVRTEFLKLKAEMEDYWREEVRQRIEKTMSDFFDPKKGSLPSALKEYLGDNGKLKQLFDDRNTDGLPYRLRSILESELTGKNSIFLQALDLHDETSPVGKLAKELTARIDEIKAAVLGAKAAEAVTEQGPQKGAPFEDMVFSALERVARVFGDVVEDVHGQNRAGDFLIHLNPEAVPGHAVKIAVDAKDSKLSLPHSERVLEESKKNWNAASAVLVFAHGEQTPSAVANPFGRLAQGYACVLDKASGDAQILEAAYRFARLDALRSVQRSLGAIEPAMVGEKIEQAVVKLAELTTVKRRISAIRKLMDELWAFVGGVQTDVRDLLDAAWLGLGMAKPLPGETEEKPVTLQSLPQ